MPKRKRPYAVLETDLRQAWASNEALRAEVSRLGSELARERDKKLPAPHTCPVPVMPGHWLGEAYAAGFAAGQRNPPDREVDE
jgi:hypothetical protein